MSDKDKKIGIEDIKKITESGKTVAQFLIEKIQAELASNTVMKEQEVEENYQNCLNTILLEAANKLNSKSNPILGEIIGWYKGIYSNHDDDKDQNPVSTIPLMIHKQFINKQHKRLVEDLKAQGLQICLAYEYGDITANNSDVNGKANLPLDAFDDMPRYKENNRLKFYIHIID